MPQAPTMVAVTIAATRMYRSLIDLGSNELHGNLHPSFIDNVDCGSSLHVTSGSGRAVSEMRIRRAGSISLNRMEVSMRTDSTEPSQFQTSQSSYVTTHRVRNKTHEVSLNADLEGDPKK